MRKNEPAHQLKPDKGGHLLCPYCGYILTPLVRMWLKGHTDYVCHRCKIRFDVFQKQKKEVTFGLARWLS